MTFIFDLKDKRLLKLLKHCQQNWRSHAVAYSGGETPVEAPSLVLVKDSGAYLMSPGLLKGAPESAGLKAEDWTPGNTRQFVVYAEGCRPEDGHIGGDDYAETLSFVEPMLAAIKAGRTLALIQVTEIEIKISFHGP